MEWPEPALRRPLSVDLPIAAVVAAVSANHVDEAEHPVVEEVRAVHADDQVADPVFRNRCVIMVLGQPQEIRITNQPATRPLSPTVDCASRVALLIR